MDVRILFVCLGNICRSPAAEAVLIHRIKAKGISHKFVVDSAGTGGWHVGSPADRRMREAARRRGIDITSKARQITIEDLKIFDFILTMDDDNFANVQSLSRQNEASNSAIIKPYLSYAQITNLTEVPDPYYGGDDGFDQVLDLLEDACDGLLLEI